jgi:hypothetical protein
MSARSAGSIIHASASDIETFCLRVVDEMLIDVTRLLAAPGERTTHWVASDSNAGFVFAETVPTETPPHEIVDSLIDSGADAAAYCTFAPLAGQQIVLYALVAPRRVSSLRRCAVRLERGRATCGPWECM